MLTYSILTAYLLLTYCLLTAYFFSDKVSAGEMEWYKDMGPSVDKIERQARNLQCTACHKQVRTIGVQCITDVRSMVLSNKN